jgi:hypothetical protein
VQFGLGDNPGIDAVIVQWPDGAVERWTAISADSRVNLKRGSGKGDTK